MPQTLNIEQKLSDLLDTRDFKPEMRGKDGLAASPDQAKVFSFDYRSSRGRNYGTMVIVMGDDNEMFVMYGDNLGRTIEDPDDRQEFYDFQQQLSDLAHRNRWIVTKTDISKLKQVQAGIAAIKEGLFEGYYGTRRISYQGEPTQARLMIVHNRTLAETDARYRHVEKVFVETADGERYKLPFVNMTGARAMLEHVRQGGRPYDVRGNHICEMVTEIKILARFNRAAASRVMEGVNEHLVEQVQHYYESMRDSLKRLGTPKGYAMYFEHWHPLDVQEQDSLVEDIKTMFIEQTLDNRIEAALPLLAKIQQQGNNMKEVDIFENWVNHLAEGTWSLPETPEQLNKLKELMSKELIVGPDATNATEQLYDLVGDDQLFDRLSELAQRDPRANVWNDTEIMDRLRELGIETEMQAPVGVEPEPAAATPSPAPAAPPAAGLAEEHARILKLAGVPVTEAVLMDESGQTLEHILDRFKFEVRQFQKGGDLDDDLYEALFDYYFNAGEMPYGTAKARTGDPYEWVSQRLDQDLGGLGMRTMQEADPVQTFEAGTCNMTTEGEYCPEHGLAECGYMEEDALDAIKLGAQGAMTGARVAGVPGAVVGGVLGAGLGAKLGESQPVNAIVESWTRLHTRKKLNEGIRGEIAGGAIGSMLGHAAGAPLGPAGSFVGSALGSSAGSAIGGRLEDNKPMAENEPVNEIAPVVAAGARLLLPLLPRLGQALGRGASAAGRGAAQAAGKTAQAGAEIAAKNAVPIGVGAGAYQAIVDLANSLPGGMGQVYTDAKTLAAAIADKVGNAIDGKTLGELAAGAVKYAIPVGIILALLYGGKKLIDQVMTETEATAESMGGTVAGGIAPLVKEQGVTEAANPKIDISATEKYALKVVNDLMYDPVGREARYLTTTAGLPFTYYNEDELQKTGVAKFNIPYVDDDTPQGSNGIGSKYEALENIWTRYFRGKQAEGWLSSQPRQMPTGKTTSDGKKIWTFVFGFAIPNKGQQFEQQGVAEGVNPRDLAKMSTEKLQAYWDKYKDESGISPVFGQQLRAIAKELTRRKKQGVAEGSSTSRVWAKSAQEAYKMLGGKLPKVFVVDISVDDPNRVNTLASALRSSGYIVEPDDSIQGNGFRVISPEFEGGQKAQAAFLRLEDLVNRIGGEMTSGVSILTPTQGVAEGNDDPMNYNAAVTGSYYESQDQLARIKELALRR